MSGDIFTEPPTYNIYEGGRWPKEMLDDDGNYVCPHCGTVGEQIRLYFWIDEKKHIDHAGLACKHCSKLGCYMEVQMSTGPVYKAWERIKPNLLDMFNWDTEGFRAKIYKLYPDGEMIIKALK